MEKVIAVLDADSFEVQVYQKLPQWTSTKGLPCVVYDEISGRIVSVSPEAKAVGIPRNIKVEEARTIRSKIWTIPKAPRYDKQESQRLRIASYKIRAEIIAFIPKYKLYEPDCWGAKLAIEQNGCDAYFLDLTELVPCLPMLNILRIPTEKGKVIIEADNRGYTGFSLLERMYSYLEEDDRKQNTEEYNLVLAAQFMDELVQHIQEKTGYICSAGIGSNKVMAKIACKIGKPQGVTAMTDKSLDRISEDYDFRDIQGFGGDLGLDILEMEGWGQMSLAELRRRAENWPKLVRFFGEKDADIIERLANGKSSDPVENKFMNAALNCSKGNLQLNGEESEFRARLNLLAQQLMERIQEEEEYNKRRPKRLIFQYFRKTNRGGSERPKKFRLSFPTNELGEARNLSVGNVVSAAAEKAIRENPDFKRHLPGIVKMSLGVTEFNAFQTFYSDAFYNIYSLGALRLGESKPKGVSKPVTFSFTDSDSSDD